ncbi:glucokinase [Streptococcus varani]|uniref:Glucokinase n=1 Tax=Streptococcus varani TaxID=1608583 RepID=A0A0E4H5C1_9STRE|nr:ROK family protein [Streptococcus varani]CQR24962.1 glucokinase [Streptococcus varani]
MDKKFAIGIDIGGTKVAVGLVTPEGQVADTVKVPSDVSDAESLFACVVEAVETILKNNHLSIKQIIGIGVGLPGKVNVTNGIAVFQNNIPWEQFPLVERFRAVFGDLPIKIDNDVKVAAYAEYRLLQLPADAMFGYITVSTGIAATNIINNHILRGSGFAGEIGFMPVRSFGRTSSLEFSCAGPAIARYGQQLYVDESINAEKVFDNWRNGDHSATVIVENTINGLADAIQNMVCLLDPQVIVLGGSVAIQNPDFVESILTVLKTRLHKEQAHILNNIVISKIEGNNGVIGSAFLVL